MVITRSLDILIKQQNVTKTDRVLQNKKDSIIMKRNRHSSTQRYSFKKTDLWLNY